MKNTVKSFICGMLVMGVISSVAVGATDIWQTISVLPNTIKVVVNGKEVQADNFLYNDTTYLPIRAVSEAIGQNVQYDATTSTATIETEKKGDKVDNAVKVTSKYTPPEDVIRGELCKQKDGIWYANVDYINDYVFAHNHIMEWNDEQRKLSIFDGDKKIYECSANTMILGDCYVPYDQFVEEIEPLLQ